mgnify:CR=1 FL=1
MLMRTLEKKQHINNVYTLSKKPEIAQRCLPTSDILGSWERCLNQYGLDPGAVYQPKVITVSRLREHKERNDKLLHIAAPLMESLFQHVANLRKMVLLTDAHGVTIKSLTNPLFSSNSPIPEPCNGTVLTEESEGTNGVGMCLKMKRPISVQKFEHFRSSHIMLACSDSPIFSPYNDLCAVLNISSVGNSESEPERFQSLQMVNVYARLIEKKYFLQEFRHAWVLSLSTSLESGGALTDGLLAINGAGYIIAADQGVCQWLGLAKEELVERFISDVFEIKLDDLMRRADPQPSLKWSIQPLKGVGQFLATLRAPDDRGHIVKKKSRQDKLAVSNKIESGCLTLEDLAGQDSQMIYSVGCIKRVMNKKISIILSGETGSGKEAFAQAIHTASSRGGAFVAVNCASIPESLIESELFGYKPGAFTGANSKGMRGKILQSDGGTLFLDEIGDMPHGLQARLLRVLSEREVTPLGSETPVPVDLHIISATHRNLKDLVVKGCFREDLYYRLNGVTLKLPALRERSDKASLIEFAFAVEAGDSLGKLKLGEDAFRALMNYSWPGNVRQLRNALRFALAINDSGIIDLEDLPQEITMATNHSLTHESDSDDRDALGIAGLSLMERSERDAVLRELQNCKWKVSAAADALGLARATMYRKMKKYNFIPPNER